MDIFSVLFIVGLLASLFSSYMVSKKTFRYLSNRGSNWALLISGLAFLICFALILFVIGVIILMNVDFGR